MSEADSVSAYDMIASWLISPSFIFLIVNLVIGTIAITSRFATRTKNQPDSPTQLARSTSSFFGRVTSFGLGCCKYKPAVIAEIQVESVQSRDLNQLDQAILSTVLDKVKSVDLDLDKTEINQEQDNLIQNPLPRAPSFLERLVSRNFRRVESVKMEDEKKLEPEREVVRGVEEEEEVDAKADDFIKRFKQQLRLERLDSILRYRDILQRH